MHATAKPRHLFVSNRSPFLYQEAGSSLKTSKAIGGLVSTMEPAFRRLGGLWIGSAESATGEVRHLPGARGTSRCFSKTVQLTEEEIRLYYNGFANGTLWPLCHSLLDRCRFDDTEWRAYQRVNRKFAAAIYKELSPSRDVVWIHDYHLALTPEFVRQEGAPVRIACFWHIPFPEPEVFATLPWRREVLLGLLHGGLIAFHLESYARNFLDCVRIELPEARVDSTRSTVQFRHLSTVVRAIPLGIDFDHWSQDALTARRTGASRAVRDEFPVEHLLLAVDRLDYTKGLLERVRAIDLLLERRPDLLSRVTLLQIAVPTRTEVPEYRDYAARVDREVEQVNVRHSSGNWRPIVLQRGMLRQSRLARYYCAADVACVTPLRDGMNLVAKEFVASRVDFRGALVLSRHAGVAEQLHDDALIVDPFDPRSTARAIEKALILAPAEIEQRMASMRMKTRAHDLTWWLESISLAMGAGLEPPHNEEYADRKEWIRARD